MTKDEAEKLLLLRYVTRKLGKLTIYDEMYTDKQMIEKAEKDGLITGTCEDCGFSDSCFIYLETDLCHEGFYCESWEPNHE